MNNFKQPREPAPKLTYLPPLGPSAHRLGTLDDTLVLRTVADPPARQAVRLSTPTCLCGPLFSRDECNKTQQILPEVHV